MILGDFLDALMPVVERLDALGIAHYIAGSFASSAYGAVRATNDVDIATSLTPRDVPGFLDGFAAAYYLDEDAAKAAAQHHRSFNLVHLATAIKIDIFCPVPTPFQTGAFHRARLHAIDARYPERKARLATPEDVILAKLDWYERGGRQSELQLRDIVGILRVQRELDVAYLRRWAPALGGGDVLENLLKRD